MQFVWKIFFRVKILFGKSKIPLDMQKLKKTICYFNGSSKISLFPNKQANYGIGFSRDTQCIYGLLGGTIVSHCFRGIAVKYFPPF